MKFLTFEIFNNIFIKISIYNFITVIPRLRLPYLIRLLVEEVPHERINVPVHLYYYKSKLHILLIHPYRFIEFAQIPFCRQKFSSAPAPNNFVAQKCVSANSLFLPHWNRIDTVVALLLLASLSGLKRSISSTYFNNPLHSPISLTKISNNYLPTYLPTYHNSFYVTAKISLEMIIHFIHYLCSNEIYSVPWFVSWDSLIN